MELFYYPAPCRERGYAASVTGLSPSSLVIELASSPVSLSSSSSLFVRCCQLCRPSQSSSLLLSFSSTLSSITIASVIVVVVVVHRAIAINVVVLVVVVHRAIVVVIVVIHCTVAIVVVNVVLRTRNSPPPPGPLSSPPPCDSPSSPSNRRRPPPLPRSDEDGEVVGGPRWLVVIALPEVDGEDNGPISLRASCAIARFHRMILFIAARLPTLPLPLPLLFGS